MMTVTQTAANGSRTTTLTPPPFYFHYDAKPDMDKNRELGTGMRWWKIEGVSFLTGLSIGTVATDLTRDAAKKEATRLLRAARKMVRNDKLAHEGI